MLSSILRIVLYFSPFIKEVFINSSEDKKIWVGRTLILTAILAGGVYLYHDSVNDQINALQRENTYLRSVNSQLTKENAKLEERILILDRSLAEKQRNFEAADQNYRTLERRTEVLRQENTTLQKDLFRLQHSLSPQCRASVGDVVKDINQTDGTKVIVPEVKKRLEKLQ